MLTKKSPNVLPLEGDLTGKILVLNKKKLGKDYQEEKYQLQKASCGFGCDPECSGTAVFCVAVADGEKARWERYDFIGIYNGEINEN